jgi:16S rRNA (guanine966-N2)-methyltransferase
LPSKNNLNTPIPKLRIIAGKWRSRVITFQPADGLRPTGDRIRETLFNWLSTTIDGARCIDVFAGSGALSFEALSRGASQCTSLEQQGAAIKMLLHCELKILTLCRPTASIFYSTAHRISPFI